MKPVQRSPVHHLNLIENWRMVSKPRQRILCVWEQGSNLGHLSNLLPAVDIALEMGCDVFLAARELHRIRSVMGDRPVQYLQSPFKADPRVMTNEAFLSYTHLLSNQCFSTTDELEMYVRAWRSIFDLVKPRVVLYEHSPTALVASLGYRFKKILVGAGFMVPPVPTDLRAPFCPFVTTPATAEVKEILLRDDAQLLDVINTTMTRMEWSPIQHLSAIYAQADEVFLCTWGLMDHFGAREGARYLGVDTLRAQAVPQWPTSGGQRVFGYLQMFQGLEQLLRDLRASGVCALLYVKGLTEPLRREFSGPSLQFTDQLLDLRRVAADVSWVINHGNHNTVAAFMAQGVPQLFIPRYQEQYFLSLVMLRHGASAMVYQDQIAFSNAVQVMMTNDALRHNALLLRDKMEPFAQAARDHFIRQVLEQFCQ
jgi:hypothetical protein